LVRGRGSTPGGRLGRRKERDRSKDEIRRNLERRSGRECHGNCLRHQTIARVDELHTVPVVPGVNHDRTVIGIPVMMRGQSARERSDERYEDECLNSENRPGMHAKEYAQGVNSVKRPRPSGLDPTHHEETRLNTQRMLKRPIIRALKRTTIASGM
jgi:hypothetical protein